MKIGTIGYVALGVLALVGLGAAAPKRNPPGGPPNFYPNGENEGKDPKDYPEPPIPGDVFSGWRMPFSGWSKTRPSGPGTEGLAFMQDSKGYWWVVPRSGV